jgi:hypothetical protein
MPKLPRDPIRFIETNLRDPKTAAPFALYPEERTFLRQALEQTPDGRTRHTELCFSAPKKSGKTALAAMIVIYAAVRLAGPHGEIYLLANDLDPIAVARLQGRCANHRGFARARELVRYHH